MSFIRFSKLIPNAGSDEVFLGRSPQAPVARSAVDSETHCATQIDQIPVPHQYRGGSDERFANQNEEISYERESGCQFNDLDSFFVPAYTSL